MRTGMTIAVVMLVLLAVALTLPYIASPQQPVTIDMRDFSFEPREVLVTAGAPVRWVNRDDSPHSVIMEGGRPGSSRGSIPPGGEHSFVFREAGRFVYRCGVHPTMLGEVTVAAP